MAMDVSLVAVGNNVSISFDGGAAELASIVVSPSAPTVASGATQAFTAAGFDQYGNSFAISPDWNVDALPVASIVVAPSSANVPPDSTQSFTAQAFDLYGNPLSSSPNWSMDP